MLVGGALLEIFNAEAGESADAVLTDAVDVQPTVFGLHVDREFLQPVLVLAERPGDVADGEDGGDPCQSARKIDPGSASNVDPSSGSSR
jgi:hypothetical protein